MSKDSRDDPAREAILRRRRNFVIASAMAGIVTSGCDSTPQPCLKIASPPANSGEPAASGSASAQPVPSVCLSPIPVPDGDAADAGAEDAGSKDGGKKDAGTIPKPSPTPRVCLNFARPPDQKTPKKGI